ncbi:MAG: cation:proton antiporter [Cypionkella sp.]
MGSATVILVLMFAVVLSGIAARTIPVPIPRPLIQIAFGCLLGIFVDLRLDLDPDLFFLLLVPPLLFLDGWRIPKEELIEHRSVILQLALGLVFLTILGIGFFAHWMIPEMPLAVAFALAAVLSPTDPVAVSAIATRVPMPRSMLHILNGEALLNDASGCLPSAPMAQI